MNPASIKSGLKRFMLITDTSKGIKNPAEVNNKLFLVSWIAQTVPRVKRGIKIDGYAEKSPVGYLGKRKTAAKSKVVYNGYSRFTLKRVCLRAKISSANR